MSMVELSDVEDRASACGLSMIEVCSRANVAYSTWRRWKNDETSPTYRLMKRLLGALTEAEEKAAA